MQHSKALLLAHRTIKIGLLSTFNVVIDDKLILFSLELTSYGLENATVQKCLTGFTPIDLFACHTLIFCVPWDPNQKARVRSSWCTKHGNGSSRLSLMLTLLQYTAYTLPLWKQEVNLGLKRSKLSLLCTSYIFIHSHEGYAKSFPAHCL